MRRRLPDLPYGSNALEPEISEETLRYHHGKHHAAYISKLNDLIVGTEYEDLPIEAIIKRSSGAIFNNAAQVFNHTFYWKCLTPANGTKPSVALQHALEKVFSSRENFEEKFTSAAIGLFGSGWTWLVRTAQGELEIWSGSNADNPLRHGLTPLLTCDVWEHAYYIDYRNARAEYLKGFWKRMDWNFVSENYATEVGPKGLEDPCNDNDNPLCVFIDSWQEEERISS